MWQNKSLRHKYKKKTTSYSEITSCFFTFRTKRYRFNIPTGSGTRALQSVSYLTPSYLSNYIAKYNLSTTSEFCMFILVHIDGFALIWLYFSNYCFKFFNLSRKNHLYFNSVIELQFIRFTSKYNYSLQSFFNID